MTKALLLSVLSVAMITAPATVSAQVPDPAAIQINAFDNGLLELMKQAGKLSAQGRFQRLQPLVERTFDLATMARFAVGPSWSTLSPEDQAALTRAFGRMTVATYAHNFNGYDGERFSLDPRVETRGPDKLVRTQLASKSSGPVALVYRMREAGETWKVIDVYYNGAISSLTGQRAEFSSTLRSGGAPALIRKLNDRVTQLLR